MSKACPSSLNAFFQSRRPLPPRQIDPHGETQLRELAKTIAEREWTVGELENWRDCGWCVDCERSGARMLVVLASVSDNRWAIHLSPSRQPGLIDRLLGATSTATPHDVLALARDVHDHLIQDAAYLDVRWCWDPVTSHSNLTPEPLALPLTE